MKIVRAMFTRQWIVATILVVVGIGVMVRLGNWQMDRLEQRRAFNARVQAQYDAEPLDLNQALSAQDASLFSQSMYDMEYRTITVEGEYDHSQEVALRNQAWNNQLGVRLLTPLRITGTEQVLLVDRGWAPHEDFTAGSLGRYAEPGIVQVQGYIRRSQTRPDIGTRTDPGPEEGRQEAFFLANVERIDQQIPYALLPVYVQQAPDPAWQGPPHRSAYRPELTEGSHLGYGVQWYFFAVFLAVGYPYFVHRETAQERGKEAK